MHYGVAGTVNPSINRGDVTIAEYWGHTALWSWQVVNLIFYLTSKFSFMSLWIVKLCIKIVHKL